MAKVLILLTLLRLFNMVLGQELVPALFVFGDSLVDDGNNIYLPSLARANYPPHGVDFGYPSGRFCNGFTVVDYAALALGLPLVPPYLSPTTMAAHSIPKGLNFGSAASGILDETGKNYGARIPFAEQLELFEQTINFEYSSLIQDPQALCVFLSKSIFVLVFGSNDYINNYLMPNLYYSSKLYEPNPYASLLIGAYSKQIQKLYVLGARKFIVVNVGPIGCIPQQLARADNGGRCVEHVNRLVIPFNDKLLELTNKINSTLPGSYFVYHDVYSLFSEIVADPHRYDWCAGFTVANRACCGVGRYGGEFPCIPFEKPCDERDQYVFWDSFHPTQAINKIVAQSCYSEAPTHCYPMGLLQLARL